jgi:hypothetical protein
MPTELRVHVFQYLIPHRLHLRLLPAGYVLSPCLGPSEDVVEEDGNLDSGRIVDKACSIYEGSEQSLTFSNTVARRLQSSWGFHWICEHVERATGCGEWSFMSLLLVCKTM